MNNNNNNQWETSSVTSPSNSIPMKTYRNTANNQTGGNGSAANSGSVVEDEENLRRVLRNNQRKKVLPISISLGLLIACLTLFISVPVCTVVVVFLEQNRLSAFKERVTQIAITAELSIQRQIEVSFSSLVTMTETVRNWGFNVTWAKNDDLCSRLAKIYPEIDTFEICPGAYIDYVYPLAGKESIVGVRMGVAREQQRIMDKSIAEKTTNLYGPVSLIEGGIAVMAMNPVFYDNGTWWGFTVELFLFEDLFNKIDLHTTMSQYQYQLYDYGSGRTFLENMNGSKGFKNTIKTNVTASPFSDYVERNMTVLNGNWKIKVKPLSGWDQDSILWVEILVAIIIIVVIFILAILAVHQLVQDHFRKKEYQFIQNKLEVKVKERTKELANSHSQLLVLLERISAEEQRTKKIINSIEDGIVTVTVEESPKILHCNTAFYRIFGFSDVDVINGRVALLNIIPSINLLAEQKKELNDAILEVKGFTKLGKEVHLKVSLTFIKMFTKELDTSNIKNYKVTEDVQKQETACVLLIHNNTDRSKLLKDLKEKEQLYSQLKERMEFQEMFDNHEKRSEFKEFCRKEHNLENILFLEDIQLYKSLGNIQERVNMQQEMFDKYIRLDAEFQLNISQEDLQIYSFKISKGLGEIELFDGLEKIVVESIIHNSYKRWREVKQRSEENTHFL
ncbi:hypothetical protein ABK040_010810 [Willaertia magna]